MAWADEVLKVKSIGLTGQMWNLTPGLKIPRCPAIFGLLALTSKLSPRYHGPA